MIGSLIHALFIGGVQPTLVPDTLGDRRAARIDSIVRAYHGAHRFDGVVLVARGDSVLYRAAVGSADHERDAPLTPVSVFPVCSITKQFTAALVLRLVEQGKLALDAPVRRWLPELSRDRAGDRTLYQLLSHSSGLPNHAALLGRRVLGPDMLRMFFSAYPAGSFSGLGSFVYRPEGLGAGAPEIVDREGAIGAYLTNTVIIPASGYNLVVLSNVAHAALGAPYRGEGLVFDLLAAL